jgi:hypothetical protein
MSNDNDQSMRDAQSDQVTTLTIEQSVDRVEQIQTFVEVLNKISHGFSMFFATVLEWYGGPGIGKTTLVKLLVHECEQNSVPWISVNFREGRTSAYLDDPTLLIEDMLSQLSGKVQIDAMSLRRDIDSYRSSAPLRDVIRAYFKISPEDRLSKRVDWVENLHAVTAKFIGLMREAAQSNPKQMLPVAVFFDETDFVDIELAGWIEERIISPLAQMKNCVIVWTDRRPWRWRRPEIRRRLKSEKLDVFSSVDVEKQFQLASSQPDLAALLFKNVYAVTGGHPFATSVVVSELDKLTTQGETITPLTFSGHEPEMLAQIHEQFIQHYVFKDLRQDVRIACELMSMVRLIDTAMLQTVLIDRLGSTFATWGQEEWGELMQQLKQSQLLVWEKGFALEPALRHLIRANFFANDRLTYLAVNQAALGLYRHWLGKPVDNRGMFIIEELYHQVSLNSANSAGEQVRPEDILAVRLQEYADRIQDRAALQNALEHLENELQRDSELEHLTNGASSTQLVQQIHAFLAALPVE